MDDLDQLPETSFEKDIVCEDEEAFCLSKDNIDSLKVLLHQVRVMSSSQMILYATVLHNTKALTLKCFSLRAGKLRTSASVGHIEKRSRSYGTGCTSHRRIEMLLLTTWTCLRRGTWKQYVDPNNSLENMVHTYIYWVFFIHIRHLFVLSCKWKSTVLRNWSSEIFRILLRLFERKLCFSGINAFTASISVKLFYPIMMVNFWNSDLYIANNLSFCTKSYNLYFSDDFNEELLNSHESEIQRLKQHFEDHKELFEGVHKWEESWKLFLELEVSWMNQR